MHETYKQPQTVKLVWYTTHPHGISPDPEQDDRY